MDGRFARAAPLFYLAAWVFGIAGFLAAWIGVASLDFYGSAAMLRGAPDQVSPAQIWRFLQSREALIALAIGSGVLIALLLRRGRAVDATKSLRREARVRRIGAAGEALVASELARLGLPALHNVILCGSGWSVELDHLVRVLSGIVILETKTFAGKIAGEPASPVWSRHTGGGVETGWLANPVLQNQAHVRALEGFLRDLRVAVCGYVVSAGRASFAAEIAHAVVPIRDLAWVLSIPFAESDPRALDVAWRRLEREAARRAKRRAAHEAHARRRRREAPGSGWAVPNSRAISRHLGSGEDGGGCLSSGFF